MIEFALMRPRVRSIVVGVILRRVESSIGREAMPVSREAFGISQRAGRRERVGVPPKVALKQVIHGTYGN